MRCIRHALAIGTLFTAGLAIGGCELNYDDAESAQEHSSSGYGGRQSVPGRVMDTAERTRDQAQQRDREMQEQIDQMFDQ